MQERKVFHNLAQQLGRNGTGAAAVVQTIRTLEKILSPHHIQLSPLLDHRADTPHGRGFSPSAAEDSLDLWFKDPKNQPFSMQTAPQMLTLPIVCLYGKLSSLVFAPHFPLFRPNDGPSLKHKGLQPCVSGAKYFIKTDAAVL